MSDVDDVEEVIVSQTINQIVLSDMRVQGPIVVTGSTGSTPDIPSIILIAQQI